MFVSTRKLTTVLPLLMETVGTAIDVNVYFRQIMFMYSV